MPNDASLEVWSGNQLFAQAISESLKGDLTGHLVIILDAPWGYAFSCKPLHEKASVLISDNPCGEYIEDLWDLKPNILLAKQSSLEELRSLCQQALQGSRYKFAPGYTSPLTKSERKILRACASHKSLTETASDLHVSIGTLKNALSQIYEKLDLSGIEELGLYYFGALKNSNYLL